MPTPLFIREKDEENNGFIETDAFEDDGLFIHVHLNAPGGLLVLDREQIAELRDWLNEALDC